MATAVRFLLAGMLMVGGISQALACVSAGNGFANCGFESGTFSGWTNTLPGWIHQDNPSPYRALTSATAGVTDNAFSSFATLPTDGTRVGLHGFDGGAGTIRLAQEMILDATATNLTFDYRAGWDMVPYGATQNRTAVVEIQPAGGGAALASTVYLTANAGTNVNDTGPLSGSIDVSAFAGRHVRIAFIWNIPENFTGPALFQLDNVSVAGQPVPVQPFSSIPTLSFWALAMLTGLLTLFSWTRLGKR